MFKYQEIQASTGKLFIDRNATNKEGVREVTPYTWGVALDRINYR